MLFERGSFIDGLSILTIHNNSGALSGANCCSVLVNRAIGQWRHWLECIIQQQDEHNEHLM